MSASDSSNSAASRRRKRVNTNPSDVFSSQEMKHIKSLRRPISSNSVIKVSSSSSSISSLTTSKTSTTTTTTTTNVGSPSGTSGRSTGAGMTEFPLEFYLRRNYPWHSVYVPQNVDKSIEEVFILNLNLASFDRLNY